MALATLQGLPVPGAVPPLHLSFSHSAALDRPIPERPLCAQFAKSASEVHPLQNATSQDVFRWFRPAGPLVSVQVEVDVGYPKGTCVLQYWRQEDADYARQYAGTLHAALKRLPTFTLRTFTPWTVVCMVCYLQCPHSVTTQYACFNTEHRSYLFR